MLFRLFSYLAFLFTILFYIGCNGDGNNHHETKSDSISIEDKQIQIIETPEETPVEQAITSSKGKVEKLLKAEELEKFLPPLIPGFNKLPSSTGAIFEDEYSFTTASSDYVHSNKSSGITIYIEDYGKEQFIPERQYFDLPPDEPGFVTKKISGENYRGYSMFSEAIKSGSINVIVARRYVIRINAEKLIADSPELKDLLSMIKINEMIKKGNN